MPYHIKYSIGDKITHAKFGPGIVLGKKKTNNVNSMAFYHVYYYNIDAFLYAIHATLTKSHDATPDSIDEARRILLTKIIQPANGPRDYHSGELIRADDKTILILDNGRTYNGKTHYHAYNTDTGVLHYTSFNPGYTKHAPTFQTKRKVREIIRDYFLIPAFS